MLTEKQKMIIIKHMAEAIEFYLNEVKEIEEAETISKELVSFMNASNEAELNKIASTYFSDFVYSTPFHAFTSEQIKILKILGYDKFIV